MCWVSFLFWMIYNCSGIVWTKASFMTLLPLDIGSALDVSFRCRSLSPFFGIVLLSLSWNLSAINLYFKNNVENRIFVIHCLLSIILVSHLSKLRHSPSFSRFIIQTHLYILQRIVQNVSSSLRIARACFKTLSIYFFRQKVNKRSLLPTTFDKI